MPRTISDDRLNGAPAIGRAYLPPEVPEKPVQRSSSDDALLLLSDLIERLPRMIAFASRAPVVHVEAPDVKVASPSVYVTAPEIKVPPTTVNVPEGKAPVVNIEPANVTLQTNRPTKWHFTFHRDEFGRMTSADAEAK